MIFSIYAVCFGVGLVYTIASAFLGHVFGGHEAPHGIGADGHAEAGLADTDMPGMAVLSPTTIASFITALGGFGMIFTCIPSTSSIWISAPLSVLAALVIATGVFFLFNWFFSKLQGSSESRVGKLLGQPATIITPIPVNGVGEIAYVQAGTRYSAPAREEKGVAVATGQAVKIVRIVGSQFYVQAS